MDKSDLAEFSSEKSSSSSRQQQAPSVEPPPDGGLQAWLQCLGGFFLFFNSWGIVNAFGTFESIYAASLLRTETPSTIAWIGSVQAFLFISGSIATGSVFDRGHLKFLICFGSFFVVFGVMMLSLCHTYWQVMLAQGLTIGIGNACLFVPSSAIIPQYFTSRRAIAMGLSICGGNVGGIIYSSILSKLEPVIGFGWAVRVIGFVMLITFIPSLVIMKQRIVPSKARNLIDPLALKSAPFLLFTAAALISYIGFYIPWFFANDFGRETGYVAPRLTPYLTTLLNAGSILGRVTLCSLADRVGAMNMLLICSLSQMALAFGWIGVHNTAGAVVLFTIYGAFSGAFISLLLTVLAVELCPDLTKLGVRTGMLCLVCSLGFLIGPPLGGKLLEHGWIGLQAFSGAALAVGTLIAGSAKATMVLSKRH